MSVSSAILFRQLFEPVSCTYTYLLACNRTQRALIIDPVRETAERDAKLIKELGLQLEFGLNTHLHADHVTGTAKLKDVHLFPKMRSVLSKIAGGRADLLVDEGATVSVGETVELEVRATPGHTNGCVSYVCHGLRAVFTGDALLIRGCGRTDFQQDYAVYPAHDYHGMMVSTVGEERRWNPRLTKSREEFVELMKELHLDYPKQIDESLPFNRRCGFND